ncbi:cohesin domain-containing protein [Leptobacterium sp. I13]|uniref:cohesin domain-containing protein n=1 Tax=Leptobacterium meishanense TaxID=3128904 RepID=UPI0030EF594A
MVIRPLDMKKIVLLFIISFFCFFPEKVKSSTIVSLPVVNTVDIISTIDKESINTGDIFKVTVTAEAGTTNINTVQIHFNFDPSLVEVVSLDGFMNLELFNVFDNTSGIIKYTGSFRRNYFRKLYYC